MKRALKNISIIVLLFFVQQLYFQGTQKNPWNALLGDVKVKYAFSLKYKGYMHKPKFGDKLQALDGKVITLRGFMLPADIKDEVFILSHNPSSSCYFCNGAGIESIVELRPPDDELRHFRRLKTDNYIEVKGRLRLNAKDYEHLIYILDDAEYVRLIKR